MHRQVLLCFQNTYVFDFSRETRLYIRWRSRRSGSASWRGGSQKVGGQVGGELKRIDAGEEVRRERRGKNRLRITRRAASYTNRLRATSMRHGCQLANWHRPDWPPCTADRSFLRLLRDFAFYHHTVIITIFFFFSSSSSFSSRHQRPGALFFVPFSCPFQFFWCYALVTASTGVWSPRCRGARRVKAFYVRAIKMRGPIRVRTFHGSDSRRDRTTDARAFWINL